MMASKKEKEKYSKFLFVTGEEGREIFNTWTCPKVEDEEGVRMDRNAITVNE